MHFQGSATSSDGEWTAVIVATEKEEGTEESVWAYKNDSSSIQPVKLKSFPIDAKTLPSVVYSNYSDSFIVYQNSWGDRGNNKKYQYKTGFYEFRYSEKDSSYVAWNNTYTAALNNECGKIYANDCGVYFVLEYDHSQKGLVNSHERASRIYRMTQDTAVLHYNQTEAMEQIAAIPLLNSDLSDSDHCFDDVVVPTSRGLIITDYNRVDYWYYNSMNDSVKKFNSFDRAMAYDEMLEARRSFWNLGMSYGILVIVIFVAVILILLGFVYTAVLLLKKRKSEVKEVLGDYALNKIVYETQEIERANLSHDIHDSVIQDIRGIRLETELLNVQEDSVARQKQIAKMATDCVVKLRNICYNLTPAELSTHVDGNNSKIELVSILQTLAEQFTEKTKIPCVVKVAPNFSYPVFKKDVSLNLFRVVQETLNNIEKHSYATNVSIFIKEDNRRMKIFITDDGVGFDPSLVDVHKDGVVHFGLQMMQERMAMIGGTIQFLSGRNDGTEIRLEVGFDK